MDKILVHLLLLDEFQIVALAGGLAIAGGGSARSSSRSGFLFGASATSGFLPA